MTALLVSACSPAIPQASSPSAPLPPDRSETIVVASPESPPTTQASSTSRWTGPPEPAVRSPYAKKWYRDLPVAKWPSEIPYDDKAPPVPGYHVEQRVRVPFVVAGLGALLVGYGIGSAVAGSVQLRPSEPELYIPVVGPAFMIRDLYDTRPDSWLSALVMPLAVAFLAADGLMQLGGLGVAVIGVAAPKKILVRDAAKGPSATPMLRLDGARMTLVF